MFPAEQEWCVASLQDVGNTASAVHVPVCHIIAGIIMFNLLSMRLHVNQTIETICQAFLASLASLEHIVQSFHTLYIMKANRK